MRSRLIIWSLVALLAVGGGYIKTLGIGGESALREATRESDGFALVELYTSQGCHSNPPADALLASLAPGAELGDPAIVTLGYHVDYWNFGGWRDPFSSGRWTVRQTDFTRRFDIEVPYTPDFVINGRTEMTGSWGRWVRQAIAAELRATNGSNAVLDCSYSVDGEQLAVQYELTDGAAAAPVTVSAALTRGTARTQVTAGENAGRNMLNTDIVQALETVPATRRGQVELDVQAIEIATDRRVALFASDAATLVVTGARWCAEAPAGS